MSDQTEAIIESRINATEAITEKLINKAIEQINDKYSEGYHQQNPHLLSTFIELHKDIYLSTVS